MTQLAFDIVDMLGLVALILAAGIGSIVVGRAIDRRTAAAALQPAAGPVIECPNGISLTEEEARRCEAVAIAFRAVLLQGYYRAEQDAD